MLKYAALILTKPEVFKKIQHFMMLVTGQSHLGSKVKLRLTVILSLHALFRIKFLNNTSFLLYNSAVLSLHSSVLSLAFTPSTIIVH